jgi:hypothetical protein
MSYLHSGPNVATAKLSPDSRPTATSLIKAWLYGCYSKTCFMAQSLGLVHFRASDKSSSTLLHPQHDYAPSESSMSATYVCMYVTASLNTLSMTHYFSSMSLLFFQLKAFTWRNCEKPPASWC